MTRRANPQHGNVGNTGDILKHAALLAIGNSLTTSAPALPLHHVETHAFLLEAPLASPDDWRRELSERTGAHPAYERYRDAEQDAVAAGRYLCSSGLILAHQPAARLHLAEKDEATRARLRAQLAARAVEPAQLLANGLAFPSEQPGEARGAVLVHVDPFTDPAPFWPSAARAAEAVRAPNAPVVLLTFTFGERPTWPDTLDGFGRLVGRIDEGSYHLAAWSDSRSTAVVATALEALGWNRIHTGSEPPL